jgi:hypothetical protein
MIPERGLGARGKGDPPSHKAMADKKELSAVTHSPATQYLFVGAGEMRIYFLSFGVNMQ